MLPRIHGCAPAARSRGLGFRLGRSFADCAAGSPPPAHLHRICLGHPALWQQNWECEGEWLSLDLRCLWGSENSPQSLWILLDHGWQNMEMRGLTSIWYAGCRGTSIVRGYGNGQLMTESFKDLSNPIKETLTAIVSWNLWESRSFMQCIDRLGRQSRVWAYAKFLRLHIRWCSP